MLFEKIREEDESSPTEKESPAAQTKYFEKMNLKGFEPSDIKVKVEGQNVIVEAKKEVTEEQNGVYSRSLREVRRTLNLPENVDKENIKSAFTIDGTLEIEAPLLKPIENEPSEKMEVPIDIEIAKENQEDGEKDGSMEDVLDE